MYQPMEVASHTILTEVQQITLSTQEIDRQQKVVGQVGYHLGRT